MSYIKKSKNSKWYILTAFLMIFVTTAFVFSSSVFSSSEMDVEIEYGGNTWDLSGDAPEWTTKSNDLSFQVDLKGDPEQFFEATANLSDEKQTVNISKQEDSEGQFTGVYTVDVNTVKGDGDIGINLKIGESEVGFSILKDATKPQIEYSGIDDGEVIHNGNAKLNVDIEEENLASKQITWTHNDKDATSEVDWNGDRTSIDFEKDGNYKVTIQAEDKAGNKSEEKTFSFYVHKEDPQWQITNNEGEVESGAFLNNPNLRLGVVNGIDIESATVEIKNGDETTEVDLDVNERTAAAEYEFDKEGDYTLEATLTDHVGGEEHDLEPFHITLDQTAPEIAIYDGDDKAIEDDNPVYEENFRLSVEAKDSHLNTDESTVTITHTAFNDKENTEDISLSYDDGIASGSYEVNAAGEYEVSAELIDQAGNKTTIKRTFTLYSDSDFVTITDEKNNPLEKYYTDNVRLSINYWDFRFGTKDFEVTKYNPENGERETYLDSGKLSSLIFLRWITHTFDEGDYELTIKAENISGDPEVVTRSFIVDKTAPEVILDTTLEDSQHINFTDIEKQGGITDLFTLSAADDYLKDYKVEVQRDEQTWENDEAGTWSKKEGIWHFALNEDLFKTEGQYTIKINATDEAGNHSEKEHTFIIDDTAPEINLTDVERYNNKHVTKELIITEANHETNNVTIKIEKQNEDGQFEDILDNFDEWENKGVKSEASYTFDEDGTYQMKVSATDAAGNKAESASATFTVDTENPNTEISGVEDQEHYDKSREVAVKVEDQNIDKDKTSLTVNKWNHAEGKFEVTDLDTELIFENNQAIWEHDFEDEGTYEIILNATDKAGREAETQHITFTIDKTDPVVSIEELENDKYYATEQQVNFLVQELNYEENNVHFEVTRNGKDITKEVEESADWRNQGTESDLTYTFARDGHYEITFHSEDKAGNQSEKLQQAFTIDSTNPGIKIEGVKDTVHYDKERKVTIGIEDKNLAKYDLLITNSKDGDNPTEKSGTKNFSEEITFDKEGDYVIAVSSVDKAGNKSAETITFTIDKTNPVISIDNQMPDFITYENIKDKGIDKLISITLTEENVKNKAVKIQVTDNKGNTKTYSESDTGEWKSSEASSYRYPLNEAFFKTDGDYEIVVQAEDEAGRKDQASLSFTVDNIKPKIDLTDLAAFNDEGKTATVKITEHNYRNNNVSIDVYREKMNGDYENITKQFNNWRNRQEVTSLDFPFTEDGKYRIVVNATDAAGNKATAQRENFTIDTVNPRMAISGVTDGTHYRNSKKVNVSVNDANVSRADTDLRVLKLNHRTGKMERYNSGSTPRFSRRAMSWQHTFSTSDEGTYRVQIDATDLAGNSGNGQSVDFTIDNTAPALAINHVTDGAYYNRSQTGEFTVRETNYASNNVQFAVTRDGQNITSLVEGNQGSAWRTAGALSKLSYGFTQDGAYKVTMNATDEAGNSSRTAEKSFVIDTVSPAIDISGVEDGEYYNEDVPVNVTLTDVNFDRNVIRVTRNGANYPVGGFSITDNGYQNSIASFAHRFTEEGNYEIFVESTDRASNSQTERISFTIDKTAPVITPLMGGGNTELVDGSYINEVFQPVFQLDNPEDTIVSVRLNGGNNIAGNVPLASREMEYNYEVLASDRAGNETTLNVRFVLDTTRPTLNITGIIEGFFNNDIRPNVEYSDTNLDPDRTSVTLNGASFENGVHLTEEGDYILEAVITDLADNVSERTIVFTIDKTKPTIRFEQEISGKYLNEAIIPQLLIEDMTGYEIIAMTLNGEPYELGDPIETEGKHVLYFEVRDQAGNIKQLTVEFIIDLTPPVVLFEGAEENKEYVEAVDIAVSLDNPEDKIKGLTVNGELYEAEVEDGVINLHFSDINEYTIEVAAEDRAGNEVTESFSFIIAEKSLLTKFYENKPLFSFTIAGVLAVLLTIGIAVFRSKRKPVEEA